jgi:hypothetical protein
MTRRGFNESGDASVEGLRLAVWRLPRPTLARVPWSHQEGEWTSRATVHKKTGPIPLERLRQVYVLAADPDSSVDCRAPVFQ